MLPAWAGEEASDSEGRKIPSTPYERLMRGALLGHERNRQRMERPAQHNVSTPPRAPLRAPHTLSGSKSSKVIFWGGSLRPAPRSLSLLPLPALCVETGALAATPLYGPEPPDPPRDDGISMGTESKSLVEV